MQINLPKVRVKGIHLNFEIVVDDRLPEPARNLASILQMSSGLTKTEARGLIHDGAVRVNGKVKIQSHHQLNPGDRIEFEWVRQPAVAPQSSATHDPIQVLYDDSHLLVVYKPAGLLTVPTPHREKNTLLSAMTKHIRKTSPNGQAYCVHRLDRGVSGLLVMAKSLEIAEMMRSQFALRKPERRYAAIVVGEWKPDQGTIESYLATDGQLNRYSTEDRSRGEHAITHFRVRKRLQHATLLEIRLETGRRNQIRVHCAEKGFPILGDPRYGRMVPPHPAWTAKRLALHAESLGLTHPVTGEPLVFQSSWPEAFREFQRKTQIRKGKDDRQSGGR